MIDGVAATAEAVKNREVSAVEVTKAYLERIATVDSGLGCYYRVDAAGALAQAEAVDAKLARGEDPGPLAGVPVGLKDLLVTEGLETTAGSRMLAGWVPPYDGSASSRLKRAGAVILGKLSLDEFAMGSSNEHSAFGPVRNPWDRQRVPGGSSGGSAAAVAASLCAGALGSDTGGSIRQPAAFCGITGLKPTYGRVSRYGVIAFASSLDQVGPMGRSALDCALLLQAIAGLDPHDATTLPQPVPSYRAACAAPLEGLRLGVVEGWLERVAPPMRAVLEAAIATLEQLGAVRAPLALPKSEHGLGAYYLIATAEASSNLGRYDGVRYGLRAAEGSLGQMYAESRGRGFGDEVKRRIMLGTYTLRAGYYDAYYLRAQKVRTLIRQEFARAFTKCDLVVGPTTPTPAFRLGELGADPLAMYLNDVFTIPCNLAGLPGLSMPCGLVEGLPVGLQLIGPPLGEERLFAAAAGYQRATDWHTRRPPEVA